MEVILDNKDWGTDFDEFGLCGKELSCHTCRVNFIKGYDKLILPAEEEEDVFASMDKSLYKENQTRMSCQIRVSKILEGAEICVPREAFGSI